MTGKMPQLWLLQKRKLEKRLYFHRTVDMKQPYTIPDPLKNGMICIL